MQSRQRMLDALMDHETSSRGSNNLSQRCRFHFLSNCPFYCCLYHDYCTSQADGHPHTAIMGRNEHGELRGICGYAKIKYEERVKTKRRKKSFIEPTAVGSDQAESYAKLRKPPLCEPPRSRLRKRKSVPLINSLPEFLFILEYEPYPYNVQPSEFLGVYSTLNSVTTAALRHGAYAFSREGLLDGSEYLSAKGRIKILTQATERSGVKAAVHVQSHSRPGEIVRLDIPHPQQQGKRFSKKDGRDIAYLAIHQSRHAATCIGLFTEKSLAWGACLKSKASYTTSGKWVEGSQHIIANNMPGVSARLVGSGLHTWFVQVHEIDSVDS